MKKMILVVVSLLLLVSLVPMGLGCSDDDTVEWTLNTYSFEGDTRTEIMKDFAARVEELSDGKMKIRVATAGEIVKGTGVFDATSRGRQELGLTSVVNYYTDMPQYVTVLSQLWGDDVEERIQYYDAVIEYEPIAKELSDKNIIPLFYVSSSYLEWYFTDTVTSIADMADHSLYSAGGAVNGLIAAVGSVPREMDVTDVQQQLDSGFIDGVGVMPFDDYYKTQLWALLPNALLTYALEYPFHVLMNKDAFEGLDADLQEIVLKAAAEIQADGLTMIQDEFIAAKNDLDANPSVTVAELSPAEQAQFKAIAAGVFSTGMENVFTEAQIADINDIVDQVAAELAS